MPVCMVKSCRFSWRSRDPDVILHVFPNDPERIRLWLDKINIREAELVAKIVNDDNKCKYRICSKHFSQESYEQRGVAKHLKSDAVPTLMLGPSAVAREVIMEHYYPSGNTAYGRNPDMPFIPDIRSHPELRTPTIDLQRHSAVFLKSRMPSFNLAKEKMVDSTLPPSITSLANVSATHPRLDSEMYVPPDKKRKYRKSVGGNASYFPGPTQRSAFAHHSFASSQTHGPSPCGNEGAQQKGSKSPPIGSPFSFATESYNLITVSDSEESSNAEVGDGDQALLEEQQEYPEEVSENEDFPINSEDVSFVNMEEDGASPGKERKFIVFESCLNSLLRLCRCAAVQNCRGYIVNFKKYIIGTAISIEAVCSNHHRGHLWTSQPLIGSMPAGDLLLSSGVLLSGSSFLKMQSFFNIVGLLFVSQMTHRNNQKKFVFPAIDYKWKEERKELIRDLQGQKVALTGDSQWDLSSRNAKCCTYSFLESSTKKILDFQVEEAQPGISPVGLQEKACKRALDRLLEDKVDVAVVCTDKHVGIGKMLRADYEFIRHEFDIWHLAKAVGTKLRRASKRNGCETIAPWIAPAKDHLWWAASTCRKSTTLLREKWLSICRHVTNEHKWEDGTLYTSCSHQPLGNAALQEAKWLQRDSVAYHKFVEVVNDRGLFKGLERLSRFCHAGELKVFHRTRLKYRSRRNRYFMDDVVARTQLAILDHNHNIGKLKAVEKRITSYSYDLRDSRSGYAEHKKERPTGQDFMEDIVEVALGLARGDLTVARPP